MIQNTLLKHSNPDIAKSSMNAALHPKSSDTNIANRNNCSLTYTLIYNAVKNFLFLNPCKPPDCTFSSLTVQRYLSLF